MIEHNGAYVRYPEIDENNNGLFRDGVHLSNFGYDLMLNTLQGALYKFSTTDSNVFPTSWEVGPWLDLEHCIYYD